MDETGDEKKPSRVCAVPSIFHHAKKNFMKDFFFTLLAWLLTLPFIVGAVGFALYNDKTVEVTVNPFYPDWTLPLYAPVLVAIAFGFLFGAIMTWAAMGHLRKDRRDLKKRVKTLEKQIETPSHSSTPSHNYSLIPSSFTDKK